MILIAIALLVGLVWAVPVPRRVRPRVERTHGAVDPAVILDLAAAALSAGISIPSTLKALDVSLGGGSTFEEHGGPSDSLGHGRTSDRMRVPLTEVSNLLLMGASWDEAWEGAGHEQLSGALKAAWVDGAAPLPLLTRSAQTLRLTRQRRAKEAAARLGSALVLPLGLCFLPAFVLIGVVPVVAAAATALF